MYGYFHNLSNINYVMTYAIVWGHFFSNKFLYTVVRNLLGIYSPYFPIPTIRTMALAYVSYSRFSSTMVLFI